MADIALGCVEKIVSIALDIKKAMETVKLNKEECRGIVKCAARSSALLKWLEDKTDIMKDKVMRDPLEDLAESLEKALPLLMECQRKHYVSHLWKAADMAKDLRRLQQDIVVKLQLAIFTTNIHESVMLNDIKNINGAPPQPPTSESEEAVTRDPLEDLVENLEKVLPLVMECQRELKVSHLSKAGDMAKNMRRVQDVLLKLQPIAFTTNVHDGAPQPPSSEGVVVVPGFTRFTFSELKIATNNFTDIIAHGVYSTVYKGVLHDGQVVAIKKFFSHIYRSIERSISNEINIFINVKHKNILVPMGYCHEVAMVLTGSEGKYVAAQQHQFCYVEAHVPNGTMRKLMKDSQLKEWSSCIGIIQGIAQGLHYLHEKCVVHLDLKPENIRFDSDMNPLIWLFEVAVMLDHGGAEVNHDNYLYGTPGYMAPEYLGEGILSVKCDVYAFGVVLVEVISSMCRSTPPASNDLDGWDKVGKDAARMRDLLGHKLVDESQLMEIKRCIGVGLLCSQFDRHDRPTMADVLQMLRGEKELPNLKKKPALSFLNLF